VIKGNNNFNSAIISFQSTKKDMSTIWSIPLENSMARIAPFKDHTSILSERNQITTRLYGINKTISATRIMSATKHLKVKTVYIPSNSKTGKRRNFAIIGFENSEDLNKALVSHVELFGCKTWWSTKDNTRAHKKHLDIQEESSHRYNNITESQFDYFDTKSSSSRTSSGNEESSIKPKTSQYKNSRENSFRKDKQTRSSKLVTSSDMWNNIQSMLETISTRLSKLEEGRKDKRRAHYRS
jgi:RNA recognition motif-containing protein